MAKTFCRIVEECKIIRDSGSDSNPTSEYPIHSDSDSDSSQIPFRTSL